MKEVDERGGRRKGGWREEKEEEVKAKEKEVARGRRTPCSSSFPLPSSTFYGSTTATSAALATQDFNYFLIRSFQPGLAGASEHNASQLLTHAER